MALAHLSLSMASLHGSARKRSASEVDGTSASNNLAAPAMKRQKSGDAVSSSTPKVDGVADAKKDGEKEKASTPETSSALPVNMMPPDFSQMQQGNNLNFPMVAGLNPFMMNPMMMGMGMGMNMNPMNAMNFMNPMMMNGMNPGSIGNMNMGMNFSDQNQTQNWNMNTSQSQNMNQNKNQQINYNKFPNRPIRNQNFQQNPKPPTPQQPAGLTGVPTGPKAMAQQNQQNGQAQQNFYPPSGPAGNKFSNQQRHVGNEEDNAYMRQPVNPHRHNNRNRRPRQADYREL